MYLIEIMDFGDEKQIVLLHSEDHVSPCGNFQLPNTLNIRINIRFLEEESGDPQLFGLYEEPFRFYITLQRGVDKTGEEVVQKIQDALCKEYGAISIAKELDTWLFWNFNWNVKNLRTRRSHRYKSSKYDERDDWIPVTVGELSREWPFLPLTLLELKDWRSWLPNSWTTPKWIAESTLSFTTQPPLLDSLVWYASKKASVDGLRNSGRGKWMPPKKFIIHNLMHYQIERSRQIERMEQREQKTSTSSAPTYMAGQKYALVKFVDGIFGVCQQGPGGRPYGISFLENNKKWQNRFDQKK